MAEQSDFLELRKLVNFLHEVAAKWYKIGIRLNIEQGTLRSIKSRREDPEDCLCEMLTEWLKNDDPALSCAALAEALRATSVGEPALAGKGITESVR